MNGILLCNQPINAHLFHETCGISTDVLTGPNCSKPDTLSAHTPYWLNDVTPTGRGIITQLSPLPVARELTHLSLSFGGDNTLALAQMTQKLQEYNIGLIGASTSVYANRMGGFAGSVKNYQNALMAYRSALPLNPSARILAKQRAHAAFDKMQLHFRHELNAVTGQIKSSRGTPLTSAQRATNIANSSRNFVKLNVTSQVQANDLVRFTQHARFLGNGLAVIDFSSRIGSIHTNYKAGGNWERELFIESSSFAASAITATAAVNVGGAALGFLMVATPIGWVGLIIGGVVVAGVAATASLTVNNIVKDDAGGIFDNLMKRITSLW